MYEYMHVLQWQLRYRNELKHMFVWGWRASVAGCGECVFEFKPSVWAGKCLLPAAYLACLLSQQGGGGGRASAAAAVLEVLTPHSHGHALHPLFFAYAIRCSSLALNGGLEKGYSAWASLTGIIFRPTMHARSFCPILKPLYKSQENLTITKRE